MCNIFNREKRHLKVCSWFQKYGRFNLQLIANSNIKISNTLMEQLMRKFVITFIILTIMQNSFNNRDCKERSIISHDCSARWARFSLAFSHKQGDRLDRQISDLFLEPRGKQGTQFVFSYHQFSFSRPSILLRGWYLRSAQLPLMNIPHHFALNWCQTSFS